MTDPKGELSEERLTRMLEYPLSELTGVDIKSMAREILRLRSTGAEAGMREALKAIRSKCSAPALESDQREAVHFAYNTANDVLSQEPADAPRETQAEPELSQRVAQQIIRVRAALVVDDNAEANHQLYKIASPNFDSLTPWAELEALAGFTTDSLLDEALAAKQRSAPAPIEQARGEEGLAWLIAFPNPGGVPLYFCGGPGHHFSSIVNAAVRFVRKSDADSALESLHHFYQRTDNGPRSYCKAMLGRDNYRVEEHEWSDPRAASLSAPSPEDAAAVRKQALTDAWKVVDNKIIRGSVDEAHTREFRNGLVAATNLISELMSAAIDSARERQT